LSNRVIVRGERVGHATVSRLRQPEHVNRGYQGAPRSGRPRLFTKRHEHLIARMVSSGRCQTAVDVQSCLRTEQNINVSITTIRNVLRRSGLVSRVKRRKPLLKNGHCQVRVAFARKHADWTVEHWKRVLWSDESQVELFGSQGRQHCWARPGMPLDDSQVQPMVKHDGGSIMGWGCMTAHDVGHHCRIDGGLDAKMHQQS
jgi:transposase